MTRGIVSSKAAAYSCAATLTTCLIIAWGWPALFLDDRAVIRLDEDTKALAILAGKSLVESTNANAPDKMCTTTAGSYEVCYQRIRSSSIYMLKTNVMPRRNGLATCLGSYDKETSVFRTCEEISKGWAFAK